MSRSDFLKDSTPVVFEIGQAHIDALRTKYSIPPYVEIVPAGRDLVEVRRPGYCTFYEYPFNYQVCLVHISLYTCKIFVVLTKYMELAGCVVDIHYLLHLFSLSFHRVP